MRITIINVEAGKVPGKKYSQAEVLFEENGNKRTWKVFDFANPAVYRTLTSANAGDVFDVTVGKNDAGYDSWLSITAATASSAPPTSKAAPATTRSTYETADERAARQRLIVRQSSLSNAIAMLTPGAKAPLEFEAVANLAERLSGFVFHDPDEVDLFDQPNEV